MIVSLGREKGRAKLRPTPAPITGRPAFLAYFVASTSCCAVLTTAISKPADLAAPQGTIVMLGGGYDEPMLELLAGLLPARTAPIEVLTTATTQQPERTYASYARSFQALDCPLVGHLQVNEAHSADNPTTLARLQSASLLLLTGGDQERLTEFLLDTEFLSILRQRVRHDAGFMLAGTSAGASALGGQMLVGGHGWRSLLHGGIDLLPGLDLLPHLLIDQHFAERARYPRLLHAVLAHPHLLGLGLSEETGLLLRPGRPAEVFGDEVVMLVNGRQLRQNRYPGTTNRQPVGGQGFDVSLLVAGDTVAL